MYARIPSSGTDAVTSSSQIQGEYFSFYQKKIFVLIFSKKNLKDTMSMSEMSRHTHPHPYVLSQMQPYYGNGIGGNHHHSNRNSQYPVSQSDWDDTHYRWPSPSLPPTLKKGQSKHHFGTLDKGNCI